MTGLSIYQKRYVYHSWVRCRQTPTGVTCPVASARAASLIGQAGADVATDVAECARVHEPWKVMSSVVFNILITVCDVYV